MQSLLEAGDRKENEEAKYKKEIEDKEQQVQENWVRYSFLFPLLVKTNCFEDLITAFCPHEICSCSNIVVEQTADGQAERQVKEARLEAAMLR